MHLFNSVWAAAALVHTIHGFGTRQNPRFEFSPESRLVSRSHDPTGVINGNFDQLIDHNNPSRGTFKQRYWYSLNYAKGSTPPVVIMAPGDHDAEGWTSWLQDDYIVGGMIAKRVGAVMLMLENRYFGQSSPYKQLTTENMEFYSEDQLIRDKIYFAKNVQLPFDKNGSIGPSKVPWVQTGCSAQGNRAIFTQKEDPDTFWASWVSSPPPQGISDFWRYFDAAKAYFPKNCTRDVDKVIQHLDNIMVHGSADEIQKIKEDFGAPDLKHNADFMNLLSYGPGSYQNDMYHAMRWCDWVENSINLTDTSKIPGEDGVGLEKALAGYARWTKEVLIPGNCEGQGPWKGVNNTGCFSFSDPNSLIYTNKSLDAPGIVDTLQLQWLLCNEPEEWWQTGSPEGTPTLISRLVNRDYFRKTCAYYFPPGPNGETYSLAKGKMVASFNARYGGWSDPTYVKRTVLVNNFFDPWKPAGYASPQRPGGVLGNSTNIKHFIFDQGNHCEDTFRDAAKYYPSLKPIQEAGIDQIVKWVAEFPKHK